MSYASGVKVPIQGIPCVARKSEASVLSYTDDIDLVLLALSDHITGLIRIVLNIRIHTSMLYTKSDREQYALIILLLAVKV